MRLHLIGLLGLGPSPCLLPSALAHHVESKYTPTQTYSTIRLGGDAGSRTRVHSAFTWKGLQQYNNYTARIFIGQPSRPTTLFDLTAKSCLSKLTNTKYHYLCLD